MSERYKLHPGEIDDLAVGFSRIMDTDDALEPPLSVTVHDQTTGDQLEEGFTVSEEQVSAEELEDERGIKHPAGQAVSFRLAVAGDVSTGTYTVRVEAATVEGQEKVETVPLQVTGPPEPS